MMKRRDFVKTATLVGVGTLITPLAACNETKKTAQTKTAIRPNADGQFELPKLPYDYAALAPHIDAQTMRIHHTKHHAGYVKKLNKALENSPLKGKSLNAICESITRKDTALRNNAGGHFNHSLFWKIMQPKPQTKPTTTLMKAINARFGSQEAFEKQFSQAAASVFGSGWAWLIVGANNALEITSTPNQDNPLMKNITSKIGVPILAVDVWEHAYYLHYQNQRTSYIKNVMQIINWQMVSELYEKALKSSK